MAWTGIYRRTSTWNASRLAGLWWGNGKDGRSQCYGIPSESWAGDQKGKRYQPRSCEVSRCEKAEVKKIPRWKERRRPRNGPFCFLCAPCSPEKAEPLQVFATHPYRFQTKLSHRIIPAYKSLRVLKCSTKWIWFGWYQSQLLSDLPAILGALIAFHF